MTVPVCWGCMHGSHVGCDGPMCPCALAGHTVGPQSANRCTPCLEGDHGRCTGSAGSVGCGCVHASTTPVDDVQLLRGAVDRLQAVYDHRRAELATAIPAGSGLTPEDLQDTRGRPILLDALVALVNGRTALLQAEVGS